MFYDIERKVDELGRVVLPIELRAKLDIDTKSIVRLYDDGEKIMIQKSQPSCAQCGGTERLFMLHNHTMICRSCARQIGDSYREETQREQES